MKILFICLILSLTLALESKAESDTLIIHLKDGTSEKYTLQWNCLDKNNSKVQSGAYYYKVRFGNEVQGKKMIVVRGGR